MTHGGKKRKRKQKTISPRNGIGAGNGRTPLGCSEQDSSNAEIFRKRVRRRKQLSRGVSRVEARRVHERARLFRLVTPDETKNDRLGVAGESWREGNGRGGSRRAALRTPQRPHPFTRVHPVRATSRYVLPSSIIPNPSVAYSPSRVKYDQPSRSFS